MINKIFRQALLILLILFISIPSYGEIRKENYYPYDYSWKISANMIVADNISQYDPNADSLKTLERESPWRRFEISFFISVPFVFLITFAGLHTYGVIRKKDTNVSVWKDYKPALLIGTFGFSTAIAAREAWITMKSNNENEDKAANEQTLYFYANKRF